MKILALLYALAVVVTGQPLPEPEVLKQEQPWARDCNAILRCNAECWPGDSKQRELCMNTCGLGTKKRSEPNIQDCYDKCFKKYPPYPTLCRGHQWSGQLEECRDVCENGSYNERNRLIWQCEDKEQRRAQRQEALDEPIRARKYLKKERTIPRKQKHKNP